MARRVKTYAPGSFARLDDPVLQKQNEIVGKWTPKILNFLRSSARRFVNGKTEPMVLRHGGKQVERKLAASLASKMGREYGLINYVGFSFERHGVFVHKGVGRGYKMVSGAVVRTAKRKPHPKEREAAEWFNPVVERNVIKLAHDIANNSADAAVNATRMKIN
jgi:hypothetical protein